MKFNSKRKGDMSDKNDQDLKGPEYTGGSVSYYRVTVNSPTSPELPPYVAECNDIIEALGMNYAEGNAFKAIWRRAAAQNLGLAKQGYKDGRYDAEKVEFFGGRMVAQSKRALAQENDALYLALKGLA